jgi:hypothetical protein
MRPITGTGSLYPFNSQGLTCDFFLTQLDGFAASCGGVVVLDDYAETTGFVTLANK